MKINKILVANRGEIAVRIFKTCKKLNIKTVAIFSDADMYSAHKLMADESVWIGPSPASQSYLLMDVIIKAALDSGADAIHPGYGFLSENETFARKINEAGLIFIGPSAEAIAQLGGKIASKNIALSVDVPLVPGSMGAITDENEAKSIADKIGYPVLIKASAGGGGKGMRLVYKSEELIPQLQRAKSEALSSFGDDTVFIEKYVLNPRHIEIQILGDQHGNVVYLFERECSIQRRHQKLVEEAPSSLLTEETRKKMGEAAVRLAKAANYYSTGTVEFVADENQNFYFLEMNTRLQVEHPVTEFITGLDLVEQQIRVAENEKLTFTQNDLKINGHAIELRGCAEKPLQNFLPSTGKITTYITPQIEGVRVDDAYLAPMVVSRYYDPMIAKLIVFDKDRARAIQKMQTAIDNFIIKGVDTTLPFGNFVMKHEAFQSGKFDTQFIQKYFTPELLQPKGDSPSEALVAAIVTASLLKNESDKNMLQSESLSNWQVKG